LSYGTNYDTDILETRYEANKLFSRTGLQGTKKIPQKNFSILLSGTKQAWWCGATGVPDACFPTVELDVGVLEKFVGHEVVDCSNSIGLDDGVKIV
jgi:hypothetical protein